MSSSLDLELPANIASWQQQGEDDGGSLPLPLYNLTSAKPASWIFQKMGTPVVDSRVNDWVLMSSPWPTMLITALYLMVCVCGPRLMQHRKPWDLRTYIIIYNFCLVLLSAYMFVELLAVSMLNPRFQSIGCSPVDYSNDPKSRRLLSVLWLYYISKFMELSETVVFILRKKNNQISFLHVYHHSSMFLLWWLTVKHCGGGTAYFPALMNSLVHTVMYLYYMLAAIGESMRPYIWWKRYLTRVQMVQFWIVGIHIGYTIYTDCGYPLGYAWLLLIYMMTQKALFMNFYLKTYRRSATQPDSTSNRLSDRSFDNNRTSDGSLDNNRTKTD